MSNNTETTNSAENKTSIQAARDWLNSHVEFKTVKDSDSIILAIPRESEPVIINVSKDGRYYCGLVDPSVTTLREIGQILAMKTIGIRLSSMHNQMMTWVPQMASSNQEKIAMFVDQQRQFLQFLKAGAATASNHIHTLMLEGCVEEAEDAFPHADWFRTAVDTCQSLEAFRGVRKLLMTLQTMGKEVDGPQSHAVSNVLVNLFYQARFIGMYGNFGLVNPGFGTQVFDPRQPGYHNVMNPGPFPGNMFRHPADAAGEAKARYAPNTGFFSRGVMPNGIVPNGFNPNSPMGNEPRGN